LRYAENQKNLIEESIYGPFPHIEGIFENDKFLAKTSQSEFNKKRDAFINKYLAKSNTWIAEVEKTIKLIVDFFNKNDNNEKSNCGTKQSRIAENSIYINKEQLDSLKKAISEYCKSPENKELKETLKEITAYIFDIIVNTESTNLELLFTENFKETFSSLKNYRLLPDTEIQNKKNDLVSTICREMDDESISSNPELIKYLIANILIYPSYKTRSNISLKHIPEGLVEEYLSYSLESHKIFNSNEELEEFCTHLESWGNYVSSIIHQKEQSKNEIKAIEHFGLKTNFIPVYCSEKNTINIAKSRSEAIAFILRKSGHRLNYCFPRKPFTQKIKIGLINAHFGHQTETYIALSCMRLSRDIFEVNLICLFDSDDTTRKHAQSLSDTYTVLPQQLPDQVSAVRKMNMDIIIFGTNMTAVTNGVCLLAQHRLSPIQLTTYCSPNSTGFAHIDGYITGTLMRTPSMQEHFTEKMIYIDGTPGCLDYTKEPDISKSNTKSSPKNASSTDVLFANAASCFKITPNNIAAWVNILKNTENSKFLLFPFNPNWSSIFPAIQFKNIIKSICDKNNVDFERFIFNNPLPSRHDIKTALSMSHIYLDTFPFSGSISVIDPLELGIPVITRDGNTHRSNMASALLRQIDLVDLVTNDTASYISKATELATNPLLRSSYSFKIKNAMEMKPIFINPELYGQKLGEALRYMHLNPDDISRSTI
jgi:predicted O-linked N-acetylglucosamine transferase (SPINDLY family)